MQQVLQELPLTLAYIGADLIAITLLVGALYIPRHGRRDLVAAYIGVNVGVLAVTLLLCGIKTHLIIVAILMALILASLWVGDHPALMRRNRNQTVTLDRAISNESELITELENLLGAQVRSVDLKSLDLVNDTTIVEVHYRMSRRPRTAPPATHPEATSAPQASTPHPESAQVPHLIQEVPPQAPAPVQPTRQQVWPDAPTTDSAATAATAPPRYDWITGNRSQHASQQRAQSTTPPPPMVHPHYN